MTMKKALICLSIVAIVVFCTLNVATASTGNYSTTFYNNAWHTGNHIPMARGSTSNGTLNWNYVTKGILQSPPTTPNGIVYVGSQDHNVYALDANTGTKIWSYTTGSIVYSSPAVANGIVYIGSLDHNVYALDANTGTKVWS
ncbi:MAG: PQQ-binding-like beta-propeller repeat protein, partial [Halobacteriota archaeon]